MFQETMNLAARRYCLLKECSKHHKKAKGKVDVQRLHIGNFWQSPGKYLNRLLVLKTKDFSKILQQYLLTAPMSVTMVRTVVTPSPTLAGAEPRSR